MAEPYASIESTKRRFVMTGRRWATLSSICFLAAAYYLCYEHFPVQVNKDTPLYKATRNGKRGIVTTGARIVVPFEWNDIRPFDDNGMAICVTELRQSVYRSTPDAAPEYFIENAVGVIDISGRQIIPATLQTCSFEFDDHQEFHGVSDGNFITFDRSGNEKRRSDWLPVDACRFDDHGLIAVKKADNTGWMDRDGRIVITPPEGMEAVSNFHSCGLARVRNSDGLFGCMDRSGKIKIPACWDEIYTESGSILRGEFRRDHETESRVLKAQYPLEKHGGLGLFSTEGVSLLPENYRLSEVHREEQIVIARNTIVGNEMYGTFDFSGNTILPADFEHIVFRKEVGLLAAKRNSKYGFFDLTGVQVIPFLYDGLCAFTPPTGCRLSFVSRDGKWGAIDSSGEIVVPFEFSSITPLHPSEYFVGRGDNQNVIHHANGQRVGQPMDLDLYLLGSVSKLGSFAAIHHDTGGASGVFHVDKGIIVPLIHKNVLSTESGLVGKGVLQSTNSRVDRFLSSVRQKSHELVPSLMPKELDVEIIYDFNGNVIWRNDARLFDFLKAFALCGGGLYCFRRYHVAKREQRMLKAA